MDLLVLYGQFGDRRDSIAMKHIGLLMMHGQLGVREGRVSLEPGNEQESNHIRGVLGWGWV
ncbi:hypothetical protein BRADI_2g39021v3 [Brachypodium distachyon]|uniref:Uncharacterized protein n=1 Tax=Brachypodium distachyon TaxID=15368 RepID=A0A0Q3J5U1_BRADI|nr:hypothetical protein BRADI_2g39021v3 [Brachypodium distachyon]